MQLPTRNRTPILALLALAIGLLVVGGILLVGQIGVPEQTPRPSASVPPPSATDPLSTPEGAVRGFFAAFAAARRTDDPAAIAAVRDRARTRPRTCPSPASSTVRGRSKQGLRA